jgi:hypothetical protein
MVRKFNIEISFRYGWEIDEEGFVGPYREYKHIEEAPISFGICVQDKGKLLAMYDPNCPRTEALKEANKQAIFNEECDFSVVNSKDSFRGTFVDALIYVQNKFKEHYRE